jgi:hypothetical protein
MTAHPVVKVPFQGCHLTAYTDIRPILDVISFAKFLRGPDGTCAFCHGDPCSDQACTECGGGYVKKLMDGGIPEPGLPVRTFTGCRWSFQHIPHQPGCQTTTWIDQEWMACPDYAPFETCPCCEGRPT